MYYTGFADEAAVGIDGQIKATKELGWSNIESRNIDKVNIHDIPEDKFEEVCGKLADAGISINCFGSAVANWSCDPFKDEDFERSKAQLERAIKRMTKLNCKMIRGMSFKAQWKRPAWDSEVESIVFPKVQHLVKMCEEAGLTVKRLSRVSIGNLKLDGLPVGKWRYLEQHEVDYLYKATKETNTHV